MRRESSLNIARVYGLEAGVLFPEGVRYFSLLHIIQAAFAVHPASYPMRTVGSFLGYKVAGAY
jgi:hypothetical protein